MARGSQGNNEVALGVTIEGIDDAVRALGILDKAIANMNMGGTVASPGSIYGGGGGGGAAGGVIPGAGVLAGSLGFTGGGTPLPPGALAPNPNIASPMAAPGSVVSSGQISGGAGGTTIINHGTVVVGGGTGVGVGGGGNNPNNPLPGWNPFGNGGGGGGGGSAGMGFIESIYNSMPGGPGGYFATHFMQTNPLMQRAIGMGSNLDGFLPQGAMSGLGSAIGGVALPLSLVMGGLATTAGVASFFGAGQMPRYNLATDIMATQRAGGYVDPAVQAARERQADAQGGLAKWDDFRNSLLGNTLRFASGGLADWYWNYEQKPAYDRNLAMLGADVQRTELGRQARSIGLDALPPGQTGQLALSVASGAGVFGGRAVNAAANAPYQSYLNMGATESTIQNATGIIGGLAQRPEFSGLYNAMRSGTPAVGLGAQALPLLVAQGDVNSINALYTGRLISKEQYESGLTQARAIQTTQMNLQIGQAGIGTAQAGIGLLGVTGGSYRQISQAQGAIGAMYGPQLAAIDQLIAANQGNPLMLAQLREQRAQMVTQQAAAPYQAAMTMFGGRELEIGTGVQSAQNRLTRSMYAGTEADTVRGYNDLGGQEKRRAALLRDQANSRFYSPEQRDRFIAEANAIDNQVNFDIPRQRGQFQLGLRQGEVGIGAARYGLALSNASLYGGIGDVYQAQVASAETTRRELQLTGQQLSGAFGPITQTERLGLQEKQIQLQRELNETLEQSKRSFASANFSVAQFSQGITASRAGIQTGYFGVGGATSAGLQGGNVAAARNTLAVAQQNFDAVKGLPASNAYRQQREQELVQAQAGAQGALQDYASLPFSVGLQREEAAARFQADIISRTYAGYGNVRGTYTSLLQNVGARGRELQQYQQAALADLDKDNTLTAAQKDQRRQVLMQSFEQRRYGLGEEAIGYQQQLENGWQDRLISMAVGMPGRGAFVSSQFTRKEAAPFIQSMSSVFGFSGAGGPEARDNFLFRGPQFANSVIGNISRPEGFMATALAMPGGSMLMPAGGPGGGTSARTSAQLAPIVAQLVSIIANAIAGGSGVGAGGGSNPLGQGSSATTIHASQNNSSLLTPPYAAGTSRQ